MESIRPKEKHTGHGHEVIKTVLPVFWNEEIPFFDFNTILSRLTDEKWFCTNIGYLISIATNHKIISVKELGVQSTSCAFYYLRTKADDQTKRIKFFYIKKFMLVDCSLLRYVCVMCILTTQYSYCSYTDVDKGIKNFLPYILHIMHLFISVKVCIPVCKKFIWDGKGKKELISTSHLSDRSSMFFVHFLARFSQIIAYILVWYWSSIANCILSCSTARLRKKAK